MSNALSNIPGQVLGMYEAGQGQRDRTTRRNALAAFSTAPTPEAQANALNPLVGMGDFETVDAARTYGERQRFDRTRRSVAPAIGRGQYGEAAQQAAGEGQVDLAAQLMELDRGALTAAKGHGEMAGAAILAGVRLPDPEQRRAYFTSPRMLAMAAQAGITPETLATADYSNTDHLRALASSYLDLSRMAGDVSLQKFGDAVQTVRTDPMGAEVLGSREIPVTRAETLDREQVQYRQQADQRDFGYRQERDQADDQYREKALDVRGAVNSTGDVVGPLLAKVAQFGEDSLTDGERLIFDRYQQSGQQAGGFGLTPPPPAGAAPAPAPRAAAAPARAPAARQGSGSSAASPVAVQSEQDFERLPVGAWFVNPADGQVMQKAR